MTPRLTVRRAATQRGRDSRTEPERRTLFYRRKADQYVMTQDEPPLESGVLWQRTAGAGASPMPARPPEVPPSRHSGGRTS